MAEKRKANEAQFHFCCAGKPPETFSVRRFSGDDTVFNLYSFDIQAASADANIAIEEVINKQATLYIYRNGQCCPYSGIVSCFEYSETTVDYSLYRITLSPRLYALTLTRQTRIFQKMTIPEIIKQVLADAELSDYYKLSTSKGPYAEKEYVVQYQETDLNFITRLMEREGLWYFFKEDPVPLESANAPNTGEQLIITDNPAGFELLTKDSDIIYRSYSEMVQQAGEEEKESIVKLCLGGNVVSKEVTVKSYNYRTPEIDLIVKKNVRKGDVGKVYSYGGLLKDVEDVEKQAEILSKQIATRRIKASGIGNCSGFRAGLKYGLIEHIREDCNQKYVLLAVHHEAELPGERSEKDVPIYFPSYHNEFACIPVDQANQFKPEPTAEPVCMPGIITAKIEANESPYAALDEVGRYKVRMQFDLSDTQNSEASKYIRLAQPYSGSDYGIHFPSHEGTEMIIGCVNGDPDKPMGLGTIPNYNTISPVRSTNKEKSIIRTAGKNEMYFDDTDKKQKIHITTNDKNRATFDDDKNNVIIETTDENTLLLDDENKLCRWNASEHTITMTYGDDKGIIIHTEGGHEISMDDNEKSITIQTSAGHIIEMLDKHKIIRIKDSEATNTITLEGEKGMSLTSEGNINIFAEKDLTIQAKNIKMTADEKKTVKVGKEMKITCGKAPNGVSQIFNDKGDIQWKSKNVTMKATKDIKMKGMKIAQN